jgi:hypothetical protein
MAYPGGDAADEEALGGLGRGLVVAVTIVGVGSAAAAVLH